MTSGAVRAAPIAALDKSVAIRVTAASLALGLLLSFVGAFGMDDDPWLLRTAWIVAVSVVGAALNILAYQIVLAIPWTRRRYWARVGITAALVALAVATIVWTSLWTLGGRPGPVVFLIGAFNAFVVGALFVAGFVAPVMDAAARRANAEPAPPRIGEAPVTLRDRLPERLRAGEIWALQAEDHYVRVHTSRGEALIRLRLADALRELCGLDGAQTHRSWWVARSAVRNVKRTNGRIALVLPDGQQVAVSRAAASTLRAAGWL